VVEVTVPVDPPPITQCDLDFTDDSFVPVSFYVADGTVYVEVDDKDQDISAASPDSVSVTVQDPTTGDRFFVGHAVEVQFEAKLAWADNTINVELSPACARGANG